MARKVQNRRELRRQYEAAEQPDPMELDADPIEGDVDDDAEPKPKSKARAKTTKTPKVKAAKPAARKRVIWVVMNDSFKPIAQFEFNQKDEADKKVKELNEKGKGNHFIQKQKVEIPPDAPGLGASIPKPEIVELEDVMLAVDEAGESEAEDDGDDDDYGDSDDDD
jgi:hypothetical protein